MLISRMTYFCNLLLTMELVKDIENWDFKGESIITIGTFDGVHKGHIKLLERLNSLKTDNNQKLLVFTFEPHPRKVLFPEQADLQLLTTLTEKIELLENAGTDVLIVYPFTKEFSVIEPEIFVGDILKTKLKVKKIVIGHDHKFGKNRKGDIQTFRSLANNLNFEVEEIPAQQIDDMNISSTRIRKALFEGNIGVANDLLGYCYSITGTVVHGLKRGKEIGFPTANIQIQDTDKLIPMKGVYFVKVFFAGILYYGMMNIGINPTINSDNKLKLEVNIFNFDKSIYGEKIKIEFVQRIRDEKKFNSIEELRSQLEHDKMQCEKLIHINC